MPFSVASIDSPAGTLRLNARGRWTIRAELSSTRPPRVGTRVAIQCGTLELSGTVRASDTHTSVAEVDIVAGANGWAGSIAMPQFRADNGVRLSEVVRALAARARESYVLELDAERTLGYAWTVATGPAATALDEVTGGAWWMSPDGVTHIGERPVGSTITAPWSIVRYRGALGLLVFTSSDDDVAAFPIGGILQGEGLANPFRIASLEVRWNKKTVQFAAWRA